MSNPGLAWLTALDDEDRDSFFAEVEAAARARDASSLAACIRDWHATARALSDPAAREVLTGHPRPEDFTEVQRPGGGM